MGSEVVRGEMEMEIVASGSLANTSVFPERVRDWNEL